MGNGWNATIGLALLFLLGGCASTVPDVIRKAPEGDVQLGEVQRDPEAMRGALVRWGGQIVAVHNQPDETLVEIISRRLGSSGRPHEEDATMGRFLAKVKGFLDPAIYASGREVTVRGRIEGVVTRTLGEFQYRYPLVATQDLFLWPPRPEPLPPYPYRDPFWWDPWYPWGWPYHYPYPYPYR